MAQTRAHCHTSTYKVFIHGVGKLTYNHTTTWLQHNVPLSPVVFPGCILTRIPPHITKWKAELSNLFSCGSASDHWQSWLSRLKCVRIYMIWQPLNTQLKGFLKSALLNTVILLIGSVDVQALPIFVILLWIVSLAQFAVCQKSSENIRTEVQPQQRKLSGWWYVDTTGALWIGPPTSLAGI